ncbi:DUF421 domain-containing protein [uncultured Fibrella sp.]|uniref:DUF421 domain-containing protein n=1 Tax=uncultured Fibrella sp. TaxID=1284596 RepID=UPI0035CA1779
MNPEEIKLGDLQRILLGNVPGAFYLEVIFRVAVLYLLLIVSMRIMGKRMASQLNRSEMIAMASLAAAIGIPILAPDRGVLPALISAAVIVASERLISRRAVTSDSFEGLVEGKMTILVQDGVMRLADMQLTTVTRERVMAQLRSGGIYQLGAVKFLLMEADGKFTLIENPAPKPGLSVLPQWDKDYTSKREKVADVAACKNCGHTEPTPIDNSIACPSCADQNWVPAVN